WEPPQSRRECDYTGIQDFSIAMSDWNQAPPLFPQTPDESTDRDAVREYGAEPAPSDPVPAHAIEPNPLDVIELSGAARDVDAVPQDDMSRAIAPAPEEVAPAPTSDVPAPPVDMWRDHWRRAGHDLVAGIQTLFSAAVYATLIVTFGFQVARVDGQSM